MLSLAVLSLVACILSVVQASVSNDVFKNMIRYYQYSGTVYFDNCTTSAPVLQTGKFIGYATSLQLLTQSHALVVRDDSRREIITSFRGTSNLDDVLVDINVGLTPYSSEGVPLASIPKGTKVDVGFLQQWNYVESDVLAMVGQQLKQHPGYTLILAGHSLGAATASLAGPSFKLHFPSSRIIISTYGQPRTGNPTYANWIDALFGNDVYRNTHSSDGVPKSIPPELGYRHHGVEYWEPTEPVTAQSIRRCHGQEDPTCSDSVPSSSANLAHTTYFDMYYMTCYCRPS